GDSWSLDTAELVPTLGEIDFKRTIAVKGEAEAAGEKGHKLEQTSSEPTFKAGAQGAGGAGGPMGGMAAAMGKMKMKNGSFKGSSIFSRGQGRLLSDELVEKCTLEGSMPNPFAKKKPGKKKTGDDDDDDDDDAPKKDSKKEDKKDDDDDDDAGGMKLGQKIVLKLRYELQKGDAAAPAPEKKDGEKKDGDK